MSLRLLFLPFVLLALTLAVAGCGGDDDDTGDDGGQPTATEASDNSGDDADDTGDDTDDSGDDTGDDDGNGGGGFGSGTGTLTVGAETYEITGIGCVFSAEEARNPDFPFNLSGFGESSTGARAQLTADIYDPSGEERLEGEGVSHNISLDDIEDFENPSVKWSSVEAVIIIDGKHITGTGTFDDGTTDSDFEMIEGSLEVDCP